MLRTLLEPFDLSSSQHNEMAIAYDEDSAGLTALVGRVGRAKNPTAALIATVRKGEHMGATTPDAQKKQATLADAVSFGRGLYRERIAKYPPTDEIGWTIDDAIVYAVDFAVRKYGAFATDEIERQLRIEIGQPWDEKNDPALGTGCPPELLREILTKLGRIGLMPAPTPLPKPEPTLAERLLAMTKAAA